MAIKRAKGQSKREAAAAAKGGKLNYATGKVTMAPKAVSKPKSNGFIGPVMPATMYGPTAPGSTVQPGYYNSQTGGATPVTQREQASKAQSNKSNKGNGGKSSGPSVLSGLNNIKSGYAAPGLNIGNGMDTIGMNNLLSNPTRSGGTQGNGGGLPGGGGGLLDGMKGFFSTIGKANADRGMGMSSDNAFLTNAERASNRQIASDNTLGIPGTNASNGGYTDRSSSVISSNDAPFFPQGAIGSDGNGGFIFPQSQNDGGFAPYSETGNTEQATALDNVILRGANRNDPFNVPNRNNGNGSKNNFDPSFMGNGEGDANNAFYQDPNNFPNTPDNGNNQVSTPPFDQAPGKVTNQMRGSGLFGTGKGVGNPAGQDDSYMKELRKAYSSNGGEKWLRQQFDELIKALDPTYAQLQTEGTNALNANLNNNSNQLASVMNAGNVGDSEQRTQQLAQLQSGNQTALGQLLAKLSTAKAGDVSQYKQSYAQQRGQLEDKNQSNQQKLLSLIQDYRNKQVSGGGQAKLGVPTSQKLSHNDIFNWTQDALKKGYSWQEIADNAGQQGIGTETGSYLDQLLNNANKQNRFAQ